MAQRHLKYWVGANWWQLQCGQNTISNRWKGRAIRNCFRISKFEFPTKNAQTPAKKEFIALLKVRIKMQCCFKCRRGSWPLLIFAICLSIAAPASSYLLLIFPLQLNVLSPAKSRLHVSPSPSSATAFSLPVSTYLRITREPREVGNTCISGDSRTDLQSR